MTRKENRISSYDTELTLAVLNGSKMCKDIFKKDWPNLLGENLNGSIAEQHQWNEDIIKEYERTTPR